jgi:hypothetical protein
MGWKKPLTDKLRLLIRKNMFNLEQAIVDWRRQMLAAGIKTPVPLEELESHLREEIEMQSKSGLSALDAFNLAVQKIGQAHVVQNEFKKVEATKEECDCKRLQILLVIITILVPLFVGGMMLFKTKILSELTSGQRMSSLVAVASFFSLVWGGRLSYGILPIIRAKRIRDTVCISCFGLLVLWWMVLVHIILPRHDFTTGQLQVTVLWKMITPLGAIVGLNFGIETAAREKVLLADLSASQH